MRLMLDTSILAKLCHPTGYRDVQEWFRRLITRAEDAPEIMISALADYEYRSGLAAVAAIDGMRHLDELERFVRVVPVTLDATRGAVELRRRLDGAARPSDVDLLMAAQAEIEGAILVTSDKGLRAVPGLQTRDWTDVAVE